MQFYLRFRVGIAKDLLNGSTANNGDWSGNREASDSPLLVI